MTTILDTVYGLLLQAEPSDLISVTQTLGYHHDQVEYGDEVREYVRKHASKRRAQWKRDLLGGEDDDDA
jgi:ubiquitin-protein ligase